MVPLDGDEDDGGGVKSFKMWQIKNIQAKFVLNILLGHILNCVITSDIQGAHEALLYRKKIGWQIHFKIISPFHNNSLTQKKKKK